MIERDAFDNMAADEAREWVGDFINGLENAIDGARRRLKQIDGYPQVAAWKLYRETKTLVGVEEVYE